MTFATKSPNPQTRRRIALKKPSNVYMAHKNEDIDVGMWGLRRPQSSTIQQPAISTRN
jgi:hypothetical protein